MTTSNKTLEQIRDELALQNSRMLKPQDAPIYMEQRDFKSGFDAAISLQEEKFKALEAKSAKLVEALEFYANRENWVLVTINDRAQMKANDLELTEPMEDYYCRQGGKRAREALKEFKGE